MFTPAVIHTAVCNGKGSLVEYPAMRGREQQVIDFYGGVGSPFVANKIRGVSKANVFGKTYWIASTLRFGPLSLYSGY